MIVAEPPSPDDHWSLFADDEVARPFNHALLSVFGDLGVAVRVANVEGGCIGEPLADKVPPDGRHK